MPVKKLSTKKINSSLKEPNKKLDKTTQEQKRKTSLLPCSHSNLVPLEVSFIRITHPNGYKEQPKCEFYVGISLATAFRVRKYYCSKCKKIIKAPSIYAEEK